ncbi:MAG: pyruvate formate lyase family protein [bacterium]
MATQPEKNISAASELEPDRPASERIVRLRSRYQAGPAYISVERARYYTASWKKTEGMALPLRVATAMKNVYENMTHYVDPDDRIAGYWCEYFLGIPIPIEKGEYNTVLEAEIDKKQMLKFRGKAMAQGMGYMIKKRALRDFMRNQKITRKSGATPLNMNLKTMSERTINPYQVKETDKRELLSELLPYWKGKCLADKLQDELLKSGLYSKDMHDFVMGIPGNTSRQVMMLSTAATVATIQGHVILDYGPVLEKGLEAMQREVQEKLESATDLDDDSLTFLQSLDISLEGVMIFARRLAERIETEMEKTADPDQRERLEAMLATCRKVPLKPADTFMEAVQSMWTIKTAVELAHPVNLHCFGRLDQDLYPYYRADLEAGRITPADAREVLEELLLKIMSQNIRPESNILANFYHRYLGSSPVTLGGVDRDGNDAVNDLTYLFLEAAHASKAITNVSVRVHPNSPDQLLKKLADMLYQGTSSYSLFNDEMNIEAMKRRGFAEPDARDYAVMGCVELTCPGRTGSMSANALLLSKLLDITLRNGDSRTLAGTLKGEGIRTGDPDGFESFEELKSALVEQGRYFIKKLVDGSNLRDRMYAESLPAPLISAFMDGCLENMRDVTRAGAKYDLSGISMINSIANMTDSLYAIKKLVFEEMKYTVKDILTAVDDGFIGHEALKKDIDELGGKWGNGEPETDELAASVMKELWQETYKYRNYKGGPFVVYVISMTTHTIDGRLSIASPDGRSAATPYAASCNPYNVERAGVTAALRSVASLPFQDVMGCAVNMKFHPSGVGENETARDKWASLIRTYFRLGGAQVQPTVASAEMLRAAQENPSEYRDLIVKVGGYSTYFVDLGREIQEEVIARTEHK